ncbi:MAG: SemiSWEET family transporter [bacterium]|nr:SemiSWEET family transporter [bacterium]
MNEFTFTKSLGFASAALTTGAFIPGVIQVWSIRPTPAVAISLLMYIAIVLGSAGWIVYGFRTKSWPLILANTVGFFLSLSMVAYKLIYG